MTKEEKLKKMLEAERAKAEGYKQILEIHGAYIAILLQRLGAVKAGGVTITGDEVKKAMTGLEVRALPAEGGFMLYIESKE